MEQFKMLVAEATRAFQTADHLAYTTYPLVKETKILILIVEQLHRALESGIDAILYYDREYKRIPEYPDDFQQKLFLFKRYSFERYRFPKESLAALDEIHDLVLKRKEAPMEFKRKEAFVIASRSFRLQTVTIDKVKHYVMETKKFIDKLHEVLRASDRRFS